MSFCRFHKRMDVIDGCGEGFQSFFWYVNFTYFRSTSVQALPALSFQHQGESCLDLFTIRNIGWLHCELQYHESHDARLRRVLQTMQGRPAWR